MRERPAQSLDRPWAHSLPDTAYPGPNIDYLHEMTRFFDYWLKGIANGVMDEPPLRIFRCEYTPPEAFPTRFNGEWHGEPAYPIERAQRRTMYLGDGTLSLHPPRSTLPADHYPHRPAHGTHAALCWGAGAAPTGLARDLRPDEALSLTYTGQPLAEPLDVIGFPEAILYLSSSAPVAHVVVRLTDVAPDGTSALVSTGILNLTHRDGHADSQPLVPGEVYEIRVQLKPNGYRFLARHRLRVSIASAYWPVIFPSPYKADNYLHRGPAAPSRLILPVVPPLSSAPPPPHFKTSPPDLIQAGSSSEDKSVWQVTEDVIEGSVTVWVHGSETAVLPNGKISLFTSEQIEMTAYHDDPAHARLFNEAIYHLKDRGYETHIRSTGTETDFHVDIQLVVTLNRNVFFHILPPRLLPSHSPRPVSDAVGADAPADEGAGGPHAVGQAG